MFSATSENQSAWSYDSRHHGIFTYFLLKKLQQSQGNATYNDIFEYLKYEVNNKAIDLNKPSQEPQVNISKNLKDSWKNLKIK